MTPEHALIALLAVAVIVLLAIVVLRGKKTVTTSAPEPIAPVAPIAPPQPRDGFTPGGHRIVLVKTLDEEFLKRLHEDQRDLCVEVQVDVGSHRPPAAFRGKTKEEAIANADLAMQGRADIDEHIDYET